MQQKTDADLVVLASTGNEEASNELILRYQIPARRIALKIVGQEELAYEIIQEAFLAAYLSLDQLRDPERFGGWLLSIVRNLALTVLKEQRNRPVSLEYFLYDEQAARPEFSQHVIDPYEQAEEHALQQLLLTTIATLSEKERNAVLLFYYRQHTIQEIATLLHISETAVKSRLFKARKNLREYLSAEYEIIPTTSKKVRQTLAEEPQTYQSTIPLPKYSQASIQLQKLAYTEARLMNQPFIGTEHLLLALFHPEAGEAASLLAQSGLDLEQTRLAVHTVSPTIQGELARGISRDTLHAITNCAMLVRHFHHSETTPSHLLLSLLLQEKTFAIQTLQHLGIEREQVQHVVLQYLLDEKQVEEYEMAQLQQLIAQQEPLIQETRPMDTRRESGIKLDIDKAMQSLQEAQQKLLKKHGADDPGYERLKQVFERSQRRLALTKRPDSPIRQARISISYTDVLMHADAARLRFQHPQHGPEHLLFGILQLNSRQVRVSQVLDTFSIDRTKLQIGLEQLLVQNTYELRKITIQGSFTPEADEAMEYAYEESYAMRQDFIGAEHLLLGLLHLTNNPGTRLLHQTGINAEKIRSELALLSVPVL